jgi:tRNA (guanine-N7-)-methyltransferase
MYGLNLELSSADIYASELLDESLKIKTHYESLDIAQSKKIFYLKFSLPATIPGKDDELHEFLKQTEPALQ